MDNVGRILAVQVSYSIDRDWDLRGSRVRLRCRLIGWAEMIMIGESWTFSYILASLVLYYKV